jgi:hypothetical protein
MKAPLVGLVEVLLASSAGAGGPGHGALHSTTVTLWEEVAHAREARLACQRSKPHKRAPELVIMITPSKIKIPDNSKRGTPLAKITVGWSNGVPYHRELKLSKNPGGICQLAGMEIQLGRDTTKADDYTTSVCTVTTSE